MQLPRPGGRRRDRCSCPARLQHPRTHPRGAARGAQESAFVLERMAGPAGASDACLPSAFTRTTSSEMAGESTEVLCRFDDGALGSVKVGRRRRPLLAADRYWLLTVTGNPESALLAEPPPPFLKTRY
jgi:hypothetical protein